MKRILVLSPHPDDEAIGCGGIICRHIQEGDFVEVVFLTSGEKGGHGLSPEKTKIIREKEAADAAMVLGYQSFEFWRHPDGGLKVNTENIEQLQLKIKQCQPDVIYVTHDAEMHPEHRAAAMLVKQALSSVSLNVKPVVLMYEVWTPLQDMDHIEDITVFIDIKRRAIQAHKSQCSVLKFDEATICLNRYRGEMHSWPGGDYAEVFVIMKLD